MMEVNAPDYSKTNEAIVKGVTDIGAGLQKAGELASNIYSQKAFRDYQKEVKTKLASEYGPTFKELVPDALMKPDQVMNGLKNVAKVMAAYDAVKSAVPSAKLADRGQLASVAFYGSDADSETVYKALSNNLDEETKRAIDVEQGKLISGLQNIKQSSDANALAIQNAENIGLSTKLRSKDLAVGLSLTDEAKLAAKREQIKANTENARKRLALLGSKAAADKFAQDVNIMLKSIDLFNMYLS